MRARGSGKGGREIEIKSAQKVKNENKSTNYKEFKRAVRESSAKRERVQSEKWVKILYIGNERNE